MTGLSVPTAVTSGIINGNSPTNGHSPARASRANIPPVTIPPVLADQPNTPKTPADEAIDFFQRAAAPSDPPVKVYELRLEEDGGPNKERAVSFFPYLIILVQIFISDASFSTHVFHLPTCPIFCVYRWMQEPLLARTVYSRPTSL